MTEKKKNVVKHLSVISLATIISVGTATITMLEFGDSRWASASQQQKTDNRQDLETNILKLKNSVRDERDEVLWLRKRARAYPKDKAIQKKLKAQEKNC